MASRQSPYNVFDKFKLPKDQINIERLVKAYCMYAAISAVDTTLMGHDPAQRDQLYHSMCNNPQVSKNWMPEAVVSPETGPQGVDSYLALVDREIAARTPPATFEECVLYPSS